MGLGSLKPVGVQLSREFVYLKKYPPNHHTKLVNTTTAKLGREYERLRNSGGGGGGGGDGESENKRGNEEGKKSKLTRKGLMRSATSLACAMGGRRRGGGDSISRGVGVSVSLSDKVCHRPGGSFLGNAHSNVSNGWNNLQTPVAHCWSEPSHFKRKYCHVCRKRLDDHVALKCESKFKKTFKNHK